MKNRLYSNTTASNIIWLQKRIQRSSRPDVFGEKGVQKFCNIHKKTPVLESQTLQLSFFHTAPS